MKVTVERADLLKALNHNHRIVERRNTIPILSNVLLRGDGDSLKMRATDLEIGIADEAPAMVSQPGATTVPAHMFYDIVRKIPDGQQIVLEADDTSMSVSSGRSRFTLQVLPEADFPDTAAGDLPHRFVLPGKELQRLFDKTQFAISTEETRYYLNGIYLHVVDGENGKLLRAVATDGHRLAQVQIPAPEGSEEIPGVIVPRKTVGEAHKLLDDSDQDITIELSDTKIRLTVGSVIVTSKLIDGTFPDYARVIPQGNDKEMTVARDVFKEAVDRVSTVSSERGRAVKLALTNGNLVLTVNNPDSGTATEEIAVDYAADDLDIGFNAKYLLDITNQLEGETAVFRLADPGSPTLIQETGADDALFVLMPMRV